MKNPALDWVMEVRDGKRLINGVPAEEFIANLPKKDFFAVILAGLTMLNEQGLSKNFKAKVSPKPPENPEK